MDVSVIVTVFNESASIGRLLDSLAVQSKLPDEVVICDGGSTDGTVEVVRTILARHRQKLVNVELFVLPGANISRGRNAAIAQARGPLIAATDAGVRLDPNWLENLTAPWQDTCVHGTSDVPLAAGGFFIPDVTSLFEMALAATTLPALGDIDPHRFLPSSRSVAFLKSTWERAGGYPEWLDYCEDLIFDFRVNDLSPDRRSGFAWRPNAIVHFRPRSTLSGFWKQYYRYARGDGKADLWRKRHAVRYVTYLVLLPTLFVLTARGGWGRFAGVVALLGGGLAYCWRPWRRLRLIGEHLDPAQRMAAMAWTPVIRAAGDCAKMAGYPVGLYWRWRNRNRPEIHWRKGMR